MTTLEQAKAQAIAKLANSNPSAGPEKKSGRIPLSVPQRKLEVPEIPGYHLRWFKGTQQRLTQGLQAGYEFVTQEEVGLNMLSIGGDAKKDGNSDMGSRVSVIEGAEVDGGQAVRLYLMKQKMELKLEDDAVLAKRNDSIADTLTANFRQGTIGAGAQGEHGADVNARYVDKSRTKIPDMFKRKVGR